MNLTPPRKEVEKPDAPIKDAAGPREGFRPRPYRKDGFGA